MADVTRGEFEAQLAEVFGPDWKSKAIVGPFAVFPLRDLPGEVGFPPEPRLSSAAGLWQIAPARPWPGRDLAAERSAALAIARRKLRGW